MTNESNEVVQTLVRGLGWGAAKVANHTMPEIAAALVKQRDQLRSYVLAQEEYIRLLEAVHTTSENRYLAEQAEQDARRRANEYHANLMSVRKAMDVEWRDEFE